MLELIDWKERGRRDRERHRRRVKRDSVHTLRQTDVPPA